MSSYYLLDPEIRPALEGFPNISLTSDVLPTIRQAAAQQIELLDAVAHDVIREEIIIPGFADNDPAIRCLIYRPLNAHGKMGAYLHIHGGGYIIGSPEMSDENNVHLVASLGILVLSVDYRLAPEHPVPAPLDDCYASLRWLHEQAEGLGIDPERIAVGGASAGGGLAAALVLRASEIGEYAICFQLLTYPMIDDRTGTEGYPGDPLTGEFLWTRENNCLGWSYYLGDTPPGAPHVPARAANLSGLPPTWIGTAALDLFRDENIEYAQRLMKAGVATELIVYPGACHGFQFARDAAVTKQYFRDHSDALRRGLTSPT